MMTELTYGRDRPKSFSWPRVAALLGVVFAIVAAIVIAPAQWRALQRRWLFHKCLQFSLPANTVVFDDDPKHVGKMTASGQYVSASAYFTRPSALLPIPQFSNYAGTTLPAVFMHEMISPSGNHRLVVVQLSAMRNDPFDRMFFSAYEESASAGLRSASAGKGLGLEMYRAAPESLTLYAGQVDPADAPHFTIDYILNNRRETIDGWLFDDDTVRLMPRCGDVAYMPDRGLWMPGNGKAPDWVYHIERQFLGHANAAPTSRPSSIVPEPVDLRVRREW